jgi:hypothetical protein
MTTDNQIATAREIANQMSSCYELSCIADDWDDWGGFSLIAYLPLKRKSLKGYTPVNTTLDKFSLKPIVTFIKRVLWNYKGRITVNYIDSPRRIYETCFEQRYCGGYERNYIKIDVNVLD